MLVNMSPDSILFQAASLFSALAYYASTAIVLYTAHHPTFAVHPQNPQSISTHYTNPKIYCGNNILQ
jgi:hypothetical protein